MHAFMFIGQLAMTETTEVDQDISSIIQQPTDDSIQTSNNGIDKEVDKDGAKAVVNKENVQGKIPNEAPDSTENYSSKNCTPVNETNKLDEAIATNSNTISSTNDHGENKAQETQAVTGGAKETEPSTSQPLERRTHKESFVSEDEEESTTTEESSQSTGQVFVIQFANTEENRVENTTVKVINTSRVETPENTVETTLVGPEKVPQTVQESVPQETPVISEQEIAPVEASKEAELQIASKTNSTDSNLPEGTKFVANSTSSEVASKQLSRTVSFTIEATSKITREPSIIVHSKDVVVSSSSSPLPSEQPNEQKSDQYSDQKSDQQCDQNSDRQSDQLSDQQQQSFENSDDGDDSQVIVNPETEEVSFRPRRRATSNTMFKASIICNPAVLEEKYECNDEDFPQPQRPRPRVSTLNRFRSSFSFGPKDHTLSRSGASFVDKSKNNFLSFHDVGYTVQQKKYCRRLQPKAILKNIRQVYCKVLHVILMCIYL